ncbi:hypothetical protein K1T71_012568 [Dendrolimus kikuchii]|uniref:Uncharacterized protein n=1 Tax=Dendrolimus kikuchii TaxID=765133 RepID=A0ACC1CJX0_9NEOP|nr:hypothetical protein K1T71_012568 [Dendrolimus kikuchii]
MAIGVDTSKWKPRKIHGTPAAKFRNILGVGIISFGIICGVYFHFSSITSNLRQATSDGDSNNATQCPVTSKYFTKKTDVDESLTEFQDTKKSVIGPKYIKKNNKANPKKAIKRIKGQKDIRTVLKSKKSEVVKYSEEFEDVCKKSGIDVDAEQLQLLIAISKSLQTDTESESSCSPKLNAQERKSKIRTTLQEYGFKVPEIKITDQRIKKFRKQYKLLTKTNVEKEQILSDRYSQVLLQNLEISSVNTALNDLIPLYNIATNTQYDVLKNNSVYYVNDLVERSSTNGCLFKDYASIPGRPISPKLSENCCKMNFSEIDCSQDELDIVLSGTVKNAKNVLSCKLKIIDNNKSTNSRNKEQIHAENNIENCMNDESGNSISPQNMYMNSRELINENNSTTNNNKRQLLKQTQQHRSCSPDIFDDEVSAILDSDDDERFNHIPSSGKKVYECDTSHQNKRRNSILELNKNWETKNEISNKQVRTSPSIIFDDNVGNNKMPQSCDINTKRTSDQFNNINITLKIEEHIPLSQKSESTKRQSNDFMDLTECIQSKKVFIIENCNTQSSQSNKTKRKSNDLMEITKCISAKITDNTDLTQTNEETNYKTTENIDLTQSSNSNESNDELPFVCLNKSQSLDTTVLLDENEYSAPKNKLTPVNNQVIDLCEDSMKIKGNESIFDEYIHDHSEPNEEFSDIESNIIVSNKISVQCNRDIEVHIDLSQISNNSNELCSKEVNFENIILANGDGEAIIKTASSRNETFEGEVIHSPKNNDYSNVSPKYEDKEIDLTKYLNSENKQKNSIYSSNRNGKRHDIDLTQSPNSTDEGTDEVGNTNHLENHEIEPFTSRNDDQLNSVNRISKEDSDNNDDYDIDLTQDTHDYYDRLKTPIKSQRYICLGKKDDISIDYDEINDYETNECVAVHNDMEIDSAYENEEHPFDYDNIDAKSNTEPNCSQSSEVFEIFDKELDYSLNKSRHENFHLGGLSVINNISKISTYTPDTVKNSILPDNDLSDIDLLEDIKLNNKETTKVMSNVNVGIETPRNSEYLIKTKDVTPMLNYASLSSPERNKELDKYGIKPLKRKRAIQLLTHLYNQTHPIVESCLEDLPSPSKKLCTLKACLKFPRKLISTESSSQTTLDTYESVNRVSSDNRQETSSVTPKKTKSSTKKSTSNTSTVYSKSPRKDLKSPTRSSKSPRKGSKSLGNVLDGENSKENLYDVTNETPCIISIGCEEDDLVFQKREKAKVHSCRVPLHITFHNYVSCRNGLRESILRYEPVNIDVIHKELAGYGHRYDPKDLLKFMDKKCITVKTSDNNPRNERS